MKLSKDEVNAIRMAIDFISTNIDGADEDKWNGFQKDMIEPLDNILKKCRRANSTYIQNK